MKKTLLFVLVLLLVLTACGPAATEVVPEPEDVATEVTEAEPVATEEVAPTEEIVPTEEVVIEPAGPKSLMLGLGSEEYPMLGWIIDGDDAFSMVYLGFLETLVMIDYDGQIAPFLAESWTQLDDTTWQFNLRQDVTFQNGEPFNADAVVNGLNYIINSPTPPRGITADTFTSIEAADEYTVIITTATLDALLPNRLTSPNTGILAPQAYTAASGPVDPFGTGTGPFILTEQVPDQSLTLVKNPNYWGGPVNLDEVTVLLITDPQVRSGMLETGEIDIDIHIPIEQLPILETNPELTILSIPQPRTTTLHFNLNRPPFDDVRVRQAISYAIDKEGLVISTLEGVGTAAVGAFALTEGWTNQDLTSYPYDPDMARQLLADAGYAEGEINISIWAYPSRANLPPTAVAIQNMLAQIGINVEVRVAQYDPLAADVFAGNFDMMLVSRSHLIDAYDPEAWFSSDYSCTGSYNMDFYCNEEFDALLAEARTMTDIEARYDIYRQLQAILDEEAIGVFLNHTDATFGFRNNVLNFQPHPSERFILTAVLDITQ